MEITKNIYQERGFKGRSYYLRSLAVEYCVTTDLVFTMAIALGRNEDFDGLVNELEDLTQSDRDLYYSD